MKYNILWATVSLFGTTCSAYSVIELATRAHPNYAGAVLMGGFTIFNARYMIMYIKRYMRTSQS